MQSTYSLEGDSPLVFSVFEILSAVNKSIRTAHLPNTEAVICTITGSNSAATEQLMLYVKNCVKSGLSYYQDRFKGELSNVVAAFKAVKLFLSGKVNEIKPEDAVIDPLKAFPFLDNSLILDGLKEELLS